MKISLVFLFIVCVMASCRQQDSDIRNAVEVQLELYPESTLQDIYKSFFQDEFGPGHLIENTIGAREYLEYELSEMVSRKNYTAEPCGTGKNFYRVPLDLVKDGKIPFEDYFGAFTESADKFTLPDIDIWKRKWSEILTEIERMDINLPNFETDKKALSEMLENGETAVHHSKQYGKKYDPHYRIIGTAQWRKLQSD